VFQFENLNAINLRLKIDKRF